jgi:hypothetical protein
MEISREVPQETKNTTTILSNYTIPWHIYPKECKSAYNRDTSTHMFIETLVPTAKLWIQPRCASIDE